MAVEQLLRHACRLVVRTGPSTDEDGEPVDEVAHELVESRCELQQVTSRDALEGGVLVTGWRAWLPADAPLTGWDALELVADGRRLELDGDPWLVTNPRTGDVSHVEANLRASR